MTGEMLLSAKDMGLFLNINRNTVASVYKELEQKGFLNIIKGSGTFVREVDSKKDKSPLKEIFNLAYTHAIQSGFSTKDINNFFITGLLEKSGETQSRGKVILIDCNYEVLETLDQKIKTRYKIDSHFMLIQDINKNPGSKSSPSRNFCMSRRRTKSASSSADPMGKPPSPP